MIDASRFNLDSPELEAQLEALVGPPGHWQARRDLQLRLLAELGITPETRFLDLGCGTLRLGLPLIDHLAPGRYVGVDIDADCVAAANRMIDHFKLRDKAPTIIQSGAFGIEALAGKRRFDMIWIFQVFIHLTDEHVRNAMKAASELLAPKGLAYVTAFIDDRLDTITVRGKWRHYALSHAPLTYYQERASEVSLKLEAVGPMDQEGWVPAANALQLTMMRMRRA